MAEHAGERRIPRDVTREPHRPRIEPRVQGDLAALRLAADRSKSERVAQRLAAPVVDGARRRSDLRVGEGGDLLLAEIDQAPLPLEQGQQMKRRPAGRALFRIILGA